MCASEIGVKFRVLLACLALSATAWACVGSNDPPIDRLMLESDLVVKGIVVSATTESRSSPNEEPERHALVTVDRLYKGAAQGNTVHIDWRNLVLCHGVTLEPSSYVLLFLNKDADNYTFKNLQWGKLPASTVRSDIPDGSADAVRLLDSDLRAELRQDTGEPLLLAVLEFAALHPAIRIPQPPCHSSQRCDDRQRVRQSTEDPELAALANASDDLLKIRVHTALLRIGDYRQLDGAANVVGMAGNRRELFLPRDAIPQACFLLASAMSMIVDEHSVPLLNRLSQSDSEIVRREVTYALRQNRSPSSVRFLIARLDDQDIETVAQATWGLFEIGAPEKSGDGWIIRPRQPKQPGDDEQYARVVQRWKDWWASTASLRFKLGDSLPTVQNHP